METFIFSNYSAFASLLDHHAIGYTYDSEPPQLEIQIPQPMRATISTKHIVSNFPLMKEINVLTRKKKGKRK